MNLIKYINNIALLLLLGFSHNVFPAPKKTNNDGFISYLHAKLDANPKIKAALKIGAGLCACACIAKLALSYKQIMHQTPTTQTEHKTNLNTQNINPVNAARIILAQGNITNLYGDPTKRGAVVSAANAANGLTWTYASGGGIAGAIGQAAGPRLLRDDKIAEKYIAPGEAIATNAYGLADRYTTIVHVAGPDCRVNNQNQNRQQLLRNAYTNAFNAAGLSGAQRIILPSISTGIFGYNDFNDAATIAIQCAHEALAHWPLIEQIIFVLGDAHVHRAFEQTLQGNK